MNSSLFNPEHLHVALNHLPFLGAGFALIPLVMGIFAQNRMTVLAGLEIASLSGWVTPFVMGTGEEAAERYEHSVAVRNLDPQAERFIEEHEHRAETWSKLMYASALVSTISLGLVLLRPQQIRTPASIAALFCVAALVSGIFIAESGGLIRRPDFRHNQTVGKAEKGKKTSHYEHDRDVD